MSANKSDKYFLKKETAALLMIDMQERLVPAMNQAEQTSKQCRVLLEVAKLMDLPLLVTEQYPRGLGPSLDRLAELFTEETVLAEKLTFDGYTPEIKAALEKNQRRQIIVCGVEAHVCVFQTVRRLIKEGFAVFLAADAVSSRQEANKANALSQMAQMGVIISNTETLAFDLLERAGSPLFKEISALIK